MYGSTRAHPGHDALRGRIFNNFFDVARARRREQRGGPCRAAASYYDAALPEVLSQKIILRQRVQQRVEGQRVFEGWCIARRAVLDEERVLLCHPESVCCAVVCGARALNFLCAANDAIYESPYSAKCRAERAVRAVQWAAALGLQLAKPSSSFTGLPTTAPGRGPGPPPRVLEWHGLIVRGRISQEQRELGQHPGTRGAPAGQPRHRKRIDRSGRDLPALFERRAAR